MKADPKEVFEKSRAPEAKTNPSDRWPLPAAILSAIILYWATWPLRNALLVIWVYGIDGYSAGIRVLAGKPVKFTTGEYAPTAPDIITAFAAFLLAVVLSLVLIYSITHLYARAIRNSRNA
ncbi:MAG: hypothetical protein ACJ8M4_09490 [Chthoniobacterales bacterium]